MSDQNSFKARERVAARTLCDTLVAQGAARFDADTLLPAETLLDLYGEDIRARAYVTADPEHGEMMLRPDFTVPLVMYHLDRENLPSEYAYFGNVFRKQDDHPDRRSEYMQVGYECFGWEDRAAADAKVFTTIAARLDADVRAATGDIGILVDAVRGLNTTQRRRDALLRHIWRPRRFRALMTRFSAAGTKMRQENLARLQANQAQETAPFIGLRSPSEIDARAQALHEDASEPPISAGEIELLDDLLGLKETLPNVLSAMRDIAVDLPSITNAVARLSRRADALADNGVDVDSLEFEASYGRTSMEYYDGFVFGFYAAARPDLPPVATGGRYDALTSVLGQGKAIPAVGGVIRPEVLMTLKGEA